MSEEKKTMYMKRSFAGNGCNMTSPSGKQNVYCNMTHLEEFCRGERDGVTFTIGERDTPVQQQLDQLDKGIDKMVGGE